MAAKRIYRNQRDKVIGGVCAGVADYFDIDVAWVRLAFVLSVFAKGVGVLAYLVAWIVFPRDERTPAQQEADQTRSVPDPGATGRRWQGFGSGSRNAAGIILIVLGALFFFDQNFYWFRFDAFWPLVLIGLGVYLLVRAAGPEQADLAETAPAVSAAVAGVAGTAPGEATPHADREDIGHA